LLQLWVLLDTLGVAPSLETHELMESILSFVATKRFCGSGASVTGLR
jgi:hypothetical protein